ncbi:MAG: hypothetical protein Q8P67_12575, partial [archaeon]|nr:hypothetical protein [archaeon]
MTSVSSPPRRSSSDLVTEDHLISPTPTSSSSSFSAFTSSFISPASTPTPFFTQPRASKSKQASINHSSSSSSSSSSSTNDPVYASSIIPSSSSSSTHPTC